MSTLIRSVLDDKLGLLNKKLLQLSSMVDTALENSMTALYDRNPELATEVISGDQVINDVRYEIEDDALSILATQQPMAGDLRKVVAAIHIAVELERIGDHASGIASLVARMADEEDIDSLHKLPKMAARARQMVSTSVKAYVEHNESLAYSMIAKDDKIDRQYRQLFRETLIEMRDDDYIRRATYLLWVGHDLERIGDRATNIAERVIFMVSGNDIEIASDMD